MRSVGRPTKFSLRLCQKAQRLWAAGFTDAEVAQKVGVSVDAIYDWDKKHAAFSQSRLRGKAIADQLVEKALFKRATGFVAPDCHVSQFEGDITITDIEKHYPPDTAAIVFWLKNRKPKEWRDRTELHVSEECAGVPAEVTEALRKRFMATVGNNGNGH
jgi:molecular chaperone DnaK (HSP70)